MSATVELPPPADISADADLAAYERQLGLRSYSRRQAQAILGCGESQLSQLIKSGKLRCGRNGAQKLEFWGPNLARFLWERDRPRHQAAPVSPMPLSKPRSPKQMTPPRTGGRPRKGTIHRVGGAS
jgi:hypothetical protein